MSEYPLKNRIRNRFFSNAYLILGENRKALAEEIAAAMVCTGKNSPCGVCSGCRKAQKNIHPDISHWDEAGEGLKAETVRALRSDAFILPNEAPRKVYLLEHAELLNPTGQNILLKLLEEGPDYACFLLLSPWQELLLPTIRSRCETVRAVGEETEKASEEGEILADFFLKSASPVETLPFLVSLEKRNRAEMELMLEVCISRLVKALPEQPVLLKSIDRLRDILASCEANPGVGHLVGRIAAELP